MYTSISLFSLRIPPVYILGVSLRTTLLPDYRGSLAPIYTSPAYNPIIYETPSLPTTSGIPVDAFYTQHFLASSFTPKRDIIHLLQHVDILTIHSPSYASKPHHSPLRDIINLLQHPYYKPSSNPISTLTLNLSSTVSPSARLDHTVVSGIHSAARV